MTALKIAAKITLVSRSAAYLDETDWLTYDFPAYDGPPSHRLAKFRGQRQKWFAFRFLGTDRDINIATEHPEFSSWRWADLEELPGLIVPFKRQLYEELIAEFMPLIRR